MNSPGKYIAAGVFIGLLMFKPSFGVALGKAIGELSSAAFESNITQPAPQVIEQPLANVPDEKEDREAIFIAISKIMDRLDIIELATKRDEPEPEVIIPAPQTSSKEGSSMLDTLPERTMSSNDLMDPKKFDSEFDKKFIQR